MDFTCCSEPKNIKLREVVDVTPGATDPKRSEWAPSTSGSTASVAMCFAGTRKDSAPFSQPRSGTSVVRRLAGGDCTSSSAHHSLGSAANTIHESKSRRLSAHSISRLAPRRVACHGDTKSASVTKSCAENTCPYDTVRLWYGLRQGAPKAARRALLQALLQSLWIVVAECGCPRARPPRLPPSELLRRPR